MPSPIGLTQPERRLAISASLALVTIVAWAYVVHVARAPGMSGMPMDMPMDMPMPGVPTSFTATFLGLFAMWVAMMAGMMLPAVLPTVLLFTMIARQRRETDRPQLSVPAFVLGYLLIWVGFSALAALLQTRLSVALLDLAPHTRPVTHCRRCAPDPDGSLPVDAAQGRLPRPLPLPDHALQRPLA